jgi:hypothetical protein
MSKYEFYRHCFRETGWVPMQPLTRKLTLGDVCQIRDGRFQPLLNIGDAHLVENLLVSHAIELDKFAWTMSRGARQGYSETVADQDPSGERHQWTRQAVEFTHEGDFIFHAKHPKAWLVLNWNQIRDDLTLKLTQLHYSFRHAYVITGIATAEEWGLAVAGQNDARLEMSADIDTSDRFSLLSHDSARSDRCTGIASYEISHGEAAHFFRAKRLVMSDAMVDRYLIHLVQNKDELGHTEIANWLNGDLYNQFKANDLNLTTSIGLFSWTNLSLDDVERLHA